ncbi:hypothetical protein [Nocardia sp. CA-290969]|uniref:hypothetical protein n=1 Tax=Nocardia sp. CA-290969 TaxID=3239986 RepID=UPI003D8EF30C
MSEDSRIDAAVQRLAAAREEVRAATAARDELLVELVGDSDIVPSDLVAQFQMTGREAASIVHMARRGR